MTTLEELEAILKEPNEHYKIRRNPDGSITAEKIDDALCYESLKQQIENASDTWLPGLLGSVAKECIKRNVWQHEVSTVVAGMEASWRRQPKAFPELQAGLKRTEKK